MSILLKLPDELCKCILTEWLEIEHWGFLDTAVCSRTGRSLLLNTLNRLPGSVFVNGSQIFEWTKKRNIIVSDVTLNSNVESHYGLDFLDLGQVQSLKITRSELDVTDIIRNCHNLTSLSCSNLSVDLSTLNRNILGQLRHLDIKPYAKTNQGHFLAALDGHCRNLRTFKFPCKIECEERRSLLMSIFRLNNNLQMIDLSLDDSLLLDLVSCCANHLVSIQSRTYVEFNSVCTAVVRCPKLDIISFSGELPCIYKKKVGYLELRGLKQVPNVSNNFLLGICNLAELHLLSVNVNNDAVKTIVANNSDTIREFTLRFDEPHDDFLSHVASSFSRLKVLTINTECIIDWRRVLINRANRIESLEVNCFNPDIAVILQSCDYLRDLRVYDASVDMKDLDEFVPVILAYRNKQDVPLKCDFSFHCGTSYSSSWNLEYDGSNFEGELWDEYQKFLELGVEYVPPWW